MPNKLLRAVKRLRTVKKFAAGKKVTVFLKTTHGYFVSGERAGQVAKHIIRDSQYEIYDGEFFNYQPALRENQTVERITLTPQTTK